MVELGSQFARTIGLTHLLSPREFGIAASLITVVTFVDMSTALSFDRHLVYAPDGDAQHLLDVGHALSAIRGVLLALFMLAFAWPVANLLSEPELVGSFATLAILPVLRGFAHLGVFQMQRQGIFLPSQLPETIGAVIGFATTMIVASVTKDHRAILWGLTVQVVAVLICSHLMANRGTFWLSFDRRASRDTLRFCLPLAVNGFAQAITYQLDRLIVGATLGVVALGVYNLTLTLFLQPMSLILRLTTTILQPHLSWSWHVDQDGQFRRVARRMISWSALVGLASAVPGICVGIPTWHLIFRDKFDVDELTFVILSGLLMVRSARVCVHLLGLSIGRTKELMTANLAGCSGLLVTICGLYLHPAITSAVIGLMVADLMSAGVVIWRLEPQLQINNRPVRRELALAFLIPAVLGVWVLVAKPDLDWRIGALLLVGIAGMVRAVGLSRALV